jgi:hypothetical protein
LEVQVVPDAIQVVVPAEREERPDMQALLGLVE